MNEALGVTPSYALSDALVQFSTFLIADDAERSDELETADWETLVALVEGVTPHLAEIDGLLNRLTALPHPLPEDLEVLEYDLNSLGQAAREAQLLLRERAGG